MAEGPDWVKDSGWVMGENEERWDRATPWGENGEGSGVRVFWIGVETGGGGGGLLVIVRNHSSTCAGVVTVLGICLDG